MERPLDVSYLYNVSRVAFLFFPRLLAKWARIVWNRIRESDEDLKELVTVLDDIEKRPLLIKSLERMHNVLTETIEIIPVRLITDDYCATDVLINRESRNIAMNYSRFAPLFRKFAISPTRTMKVCSMH